MPQTFTSAQRLQLLNVLRIGKANAINAKTISQSLHFPIGGNQVKTRSLIRECIEFDHDLIASSLSKPKGFYLIDVTNKIELDLYVDSLRGRAVDILKRREWMIINWNRAVANNPTNKIIEYVKP